MQNLIFPSKEDNYGGVDRFWFAPEEDILGFDELGNLLLKPGKFWYRGKGIKNSSSLGINPRIEKGGVVLDISLVGKIAKYRPSIESLFRKMCDQRFCILVKDRNGFVMQFGRPNELLSFSFVQKTGQNPFEMNGFEFQFSGTMKAEKTSYDALILDNDTPPSTELIGPPVKIFINNNLVGLVNPGESFSINTEFTLEFEILP